MNDQVPSNYPNIRQSWMIIGIVMLITVVISPVFLLLDNVLEKDFAMLLSFGHGVFLFVDTSDAKKNNR